MRTYHVYILASPSRRTYIGVTNNLVRRIWQHRNATGSAFSSRYGITMLVYHESTGDINAALAREKQLKRWSRHRKVRLIEADNFGWLDLARDWFRN